MLSNSNEFGALEISMFAPREIRFLSPTMKSSHFARVMLHHANQVALVSMAKKHNAYIVSAE